MQLTNEGRKAGRLTPTGLALVVLLGALTIGAGQDERLEGFRATLDQLALTQRILSKEKSDWAVGKEILAERIELVQNEIASIGETTGQSRKSIEETEAQKTELTDENERLKQASAALEESVSELERRSLELLARLPDPIRERVRPLSQRLPGASAEAAAEDQAARKKKQPSLSERFQNVVGILNEIDKFNLDVTLTSEVRTLGNGTSAEVTALYVGLGKGWYVSADGASAGVGGPRPDGWTWKPANDLGPAIAEAVAILEGEKVGAFVRLPVQID
jgi:hypothetical protein